MTEWISYESSDEPVSEVSIDVDLDDDADFRQEHPVAIIVTARGFDADSDGQPNGAQSDGLYELEQAVERAFSENEGALTCTVTADGSFRLYGYAATSAAEAAVRGAASSNAFRVDVRSESDADWSHYEANILRGEELEEARDEDQIEQLAEGGNDMNAYYDVDFALEFDTYDDARASVAALQEAGFLANDPLGDIQEREVSAVRTMQLTPEALKAARLQLQSIIAPHSGHYAGWGAEQTTEAV